MKSLLPLTQNSIYKLSRNKRKKWLIDNGYLTLNQTPRYLKAWQKVSEYFDLDIDTEIINGKTNFNSLRMPSFNNKFVSLPYLLQIIHNEIPNNLEILSKVDIQIVNQMKKLGFSGVKGYEKTDLQTAANYLQSGHLVNFFIIVCPDWHYDLTTRAYTFDGLSDGIGLVALEAIHNLPLILNTFSQYRNNIHFHVVVHDLGGLSQEQLKRAKIGSFEEFKLYCTRSKEQIYANLIETMDHKQFSLTLMSDMLDPEYNIAVYNQKINFLTDELTDDLICDIFGSMSQFNDSLTIRESLYLRLYPSEKRDALRKIFIRQLADYNIVLKSLSRLYDNLVILGFDARVMHYGYKWEDKKIPILSYIKSAIY